MSCRGECLPGHIEGVARHHHSPTCVDRQPDACVCGHVWREHGYAMDGSGTLVPCREKGCVCTAFKPVWL